MVDVECTRCGASGTNFKTERDAKLTLKHNERCGQKVGIVKYFIGTKSKRTQGVPETFDDVSKIGNDTPHPVVKPKKKKTKKKSD
jgi:hypothetical protein